MLSRQTLSDRLGMASRSSSTALPCALPLSRIIQAPAERAAIALRAQLSAAQITIATNQPTAGGNYGDESRPD
jgi:hypothetical protein